MSRTNLALLSAHSRWYRSTSEWKIMSPRGKVLNTLRNTMGYEHFCYKKCYITVHRFVTYEKYWNRLFAKWIVVRHLDGNMTNNRPENLSIWTQSENMLDVPKERRVKHAIHSSSFIMIHDHRLIISLRNAWMTYAQIKEITGIKSGGTLSFIIRNSLESKWINRI